MQVSADEARLLFVKWQEATTPVRVKLLSAMLIFDGEGAVTGVGPEALELHGESFHLTIPLTDAAFSFSDPREIPVPSVRESESAKYEFGVSIEFANGERMVLLEIKSPDEDQDREEDDD